MAYAIVNIVHTYILTSYIASCSDNTLVELLNDGLCQELIIESQIHWSICNIAW